MQVLTKMFTAAMLAAGAGTIPAILPLHATETRKDEAHPYRLKTVDVPEYPQNPPNSYGGSLLTDILLHSKKGPYIAKFPISPATLGHETVHKINHALIEQYRDHPDYKNVIEYKSRGLTYGLNGVQAVYLGEGKAAIVKTPRGVFIEDVAASIPVRLRGATFDTYFTRPIRENAQAGFPTYMSTYVLEEASAYALDARIAMELHDTKYYQDLLAKGQKLAETQGAGEFVSYVLAFGSLIEKNPAAYGNGEDRERIYAVIKHLAETLSASYKAGLDTARYPAFSNGRKDYLDTLRIDPQAQNLRDFAVRTFGRDWLEDILREPQKSKPGPDGPKPGL